jgi:HEAT repeat protein
LEPAEPAEPPRTGPAGPGVDEPDALRRRQAALAGHQGDLPGARRALTDRSAAVRATGLGALSRMGRLRAADVAAGLADPSPVVRRRACEVSVALARLARPVVAALADPDAGVVEAACFALGERGAAATPAVAALAGVATGHPDPLCREAAVAALGAVGDRLGLPAILAATTDKPAVRRRAVLALAPFSGPEVDAALARAGRDRDWQVRQAAEDLSGPLR